MKLPDFIIVGETKCGTTSLYNYLIQHPDILDTYGNRIDRTSKAYRTKEIRYFDRYYSKGIEWYKSCFPTTEKHQVTGEATPMYLYRALALQRMKKALTDTKFIIMLRNPVDRLYSHFNHYHQWVPGWVEKYQNFEDFINSAREEDYYMIDKGIYVTSINKWFAIFEKDRFTIVRSEDLLTQTQQVYNDVIGFLGLDNIHILSNIKMYRTNIYTPMKKKTREYLNIFYSRYNNDLYKTIGRDMHWIEES